MPLFRQTMEPVEKVLKDAKMDKSMVHDVVLVGGSTRIPKVSFLFCRTGVERRGGTGRWTRAWCMPWWCVHSPDPGFLLPCLLPTHSPPGTFSAGPAAAAGLFQRQGAEQEHQP